MSNNSNKVALIAKVFKFIIIISIALILAYVAIYATKTKIAEEKEKQYQIVAEISYTDDVRVKNDLELFGEKFGVKLNDGKYENSRFLVTVIGVALFEIELVLLVLFLDCMNKLFSDFAKK